MLSLIWKFTKWYLIICTVVFFAVAATATYFAYKQAKQFTETEPTIEASTAPDAPPSHANPITVDKQ